MLITTKLYNANLIYFIKQRAYFTSNIEAGNGNFEMKYETKRERLIKMKVFRMYTKSIGSNRLVSAISILLTVKVQLLPGKKTQK